MKKSVKVLLSRVLTVAMLASAAFANVNASEAVVDAVVEVAAEDTVATYGSVEAEAVTEAETGTEATTEAGTETTTEAAGSETAAATPEAGKTYIADFAALITDGSLEANKKLNGWSTADGIISVVSATDGAYAHDGAHGAALTNGDVVQVAVAGNAEITIAFCKYGSGKQYVVTDAAGNVIDTVSAVVENDGETAVVSYKGEATTLSFTVECEGETYLHSIKAANAALPTGEAESFELWLDDIATNVSSTNESGETVVTKTVEPGEYKYKDSVLTLIGSGDTKFTPSWSQGCNIVRAGRTVDGYKAGPRHATANDIPTIPVAGDGTAILFTPAAAGMFNAYIASTSFLRVWDFDAVTGERYGYVDSDSSVESFAFKAEPGHTYVLSTTGKTNNMVYAGFEYIVDEPVTIDVSEKAVGVGNYSTTEVYLTDVALGSVEATVKADTTSVNLAKDHVYKLTTNDGGVKATVAGSETFKADGSAIVIELDDIPDVTLTGTITGTPVGTVESLTFTNMLNGTVVTAAITDDTYSATLKPGEYNTAVVTNNGGVTYDRVSVKQDAENVNEVYVEVPAVDSATVYDLPTEVANAETALTLNGITPNNDTSVKGVAGSTVVVPVSGVQRVTVAGWYAGTWDINGKNSVTTDSSANAASPTTTSYFTDGTETSVTVNITGDGANYLYWIKVEDAIGFKSEISVPGDYDTLGEAAAAISAMANRPEGEEGRVTINLTADLFEQVVIDAPYVTLNGNGHEITWYYGVGTFYYSVDPSTGLYNERLFRDKYSCAEGNGSLWGGVVIIRGDNFIATDTTFKNTYNYYITDKELEDIDHTASGIPERTKDTDVTKYASKERSNAFYIEADNIECYNCNILSSQDTLGRNGDKNNNYHTYFKNCVIGGNTDYICGEFTAIFDDCELQWKTYASDASNNGKIGYIVAPKTSPYIFRNCTITTDGVNGEDAVSGLYGRTWGNNSCAYYIDTETNGYIKDEGWGEMSAGQAASASFNEYGNTSGGVAFGPTTNGTAVEEALAETIKSDAVIANYLNNWTPVYYGYNEGYKWGDVDHSKTVEAFDAALVLQYVLNKDVFTNTTKAEVEGLSNEPVNTLFDISLADVANDGVIDAYDASCIMQKVIDDTYLMPVEVESKAPVAGPDPTTEVTTEVTTETATETTTEAATETTTEAATETTTETATETTTETATETTTSSSFAYSYVPDRDVTGVEAGAQAYAEGDVVYTDDNATITAAKQIMFKKSDSPVTVGDSTYAYFIATNSVNSSISVNGGEVKNWRKVFDITAAQDCTISIDCKINSGKIAAVAKGDDENGYTALNDNTYVSPSEDGYYTIVFDLLAGEAVCFMGQATNIPVYGVNVEPAKVVSGATVYVVGDSTACYYAPTADTNYYYKRVGFGTGLESFINENATVENLALSGRSSKSFLTESNYTKLVNNIKAGDILIIAFGHNDEKADDVTRYTDPIGDKDTEGSFKNSLYVNYVKVALDAGATPIICSPIVRRTPDGEWKDSYLHKANGGDYALCAKELAEEVGVPFIDLTGLTQAKYDELTPSKTVLLHAWTNSNETSVDNTHLNNYGAKEVAYLIATNAPEVLQPYIVSPITEPTEADLVVNPDYVESSTDDPTDLVSKLWTTSAPWYGSVFGDIGGDSKLHAVDSDGAAIADQIAINPATNNSYYNIAENADGTVNIRSGELGEDGVTAVSSVGKIASTSDAFAFYYTPVDAGTNFEISGTVTVNGAAKNNQVSFGALVSDFIRVDTYNAESYRYVAAAPLRLARIGTTDATTGAELYANSTFQRIITEEDGKIVENKLAYGPENIATDIQPGDTVKVSIKKLGNVYTCTYGDTVQTYTMDATGTVYAGFFATRCADITVSDIVYNNEVVE